MNKNNNSMMSLIFLVLITMIPQFGYAGYTVQSFDAMEEISSNDNNDDIKMIAMGISELRDGSYQVRLLLENNSEAIADLRNNFVLKLIDNENKGHEVGIASVDYGKCPSHILSKACMVTITTEKIVSDNVGKYEGYSISI